MKEIYKFSGNKTLSELTAEDYFDIPLFKKSDFIRAQKEGCTIYCKTFEFKDYKVERYFIRISKTNTFHYANQ